MIVCGFRRQEMDSSQTGSDGDNLFIALRPFPHLYERYVHPVTADASKALQRADLLTMRPFVMAIFDRRVESC
jgi:hypothetical protein